jgi:hypothetical protein
MNVMLCLLSDQHMPNLLAVHHHRPDQLVLLESPQMKERSVSTHFLAALASGNLDYGSRCHVQSLASEDNLPLIREALQQAYDRFPSATWIANVTGGTKPMSIATYDFFKQRGGRINYTNLSRPETLIDLETGDTATCNHRPTVEEFVTGYGFRLQKGTEDLEAAKQRAAQPLWLDTAKIMAAKSAGHDAVDLTDEEWALCRKKGCTLAAEKFTLPSDDLRARWMDGAPTRRLTKYEGEFLTGGWLEVFFYNLLSRHAEALEIWDVTLGHNICRSVGETDVGNDIDVSFMHRHGLAMVECKSGTQEYDRGGGLDQLYKIDSVAKNLRALRVRSYLATTGTNVLAADGTVKSQLRNRAALYNCRILTRDEIRQLAQLELDQAPDAAHRTKTLLGL